MKSKVFNVFLMLISSVRTTSESARRPLLHTLRYFLTLFPQSFLFLILTLNKTHYLHGNSFLVYKDSFPKWIEDHGEPDFSFDEYIFEPSITDIDPPYVLYKFKDEKYFYVVKNNDTLKFELGDF